jgi:hypothetical protein
MASQVLRFVYGLDESYSEFVAARLEGREAA